jgi:NADH-quinone oxidoreductase subunit N
VIALLGSRKQGQTTSWRDYGRACGTRTRCFAALMTVCLLSLGGLPPTAGLHRQVVHLHRRGGGPGYYWLGDHRHADERRVGVSSTSRVVVMMYMADREGVAAPRRITTFGMAALTLAIVAIFYLGILPTPILNLAADSIATIF